MEEKITVLIVDDIEDNRLVVKTICKKIPNLEIFEAQNGAEAVEMYGSKQHDIVLMDIMMPVMDGFEATKIIKNTDNPPYVLIITAASDKETEEKFINLGIDGYIQKPIDKEILINKIEALKNAAMIKKGSKSGLSTKKPISKQAVSCRNFKTYFSIENEEDVMNMGLWINDYKQGYTRATSTFEFEDSLNAVYKVCRVSLKKSPHITAIVEEDFENLYLTFIFSTSINCADIENVITRNIAHNIICESSLLYLKIKMFDDQRKVEIAKSQLPADKKEKINVSEQDLKILRHSHTDKISAIQYVEEVSKEGLIDEIHDLMDIESVWADKISKLKSASKISFLHELSDEAIFEYSKTINKLYEFSSIGYALSSLCSFLKTIEEAKFKEVSPKLTLLLEHILFDLSSWRSTVFEQKSTNDIHYLDSSLLSSCMQIDAMISQKAADSHDDNDLELF